MVLSSQQARPSSARSYMYARRGRQSRLILIAGGALVVIAGGWFFWPDRSEGGESATSESRNEEQAHDGAGTAERFARADENEVTGLLPLTDDARRGRDDPPASARLRPSEGAGTESPGGSIITMGDPPVDAGEDEAVNQEAEQTPSDSTDRAATAPQGGDRSGEAPVHRTAPTLPTPALDSEVERLLERAQQHERANRLVDARESYNFALHHRRVGTAAPQIRDTMSRLNETLLFSSTVVEGDPYSERYRIQRGELLSSIAPKHDVDWRFIARINGISDPRRVQAGQAIKLVNGPFHAVIDKSEYRLDLYVGHPDSAGRRMYVRSWRVGLGEHDSTPTGAWVVRTGSKLINPPWTNPRTGERFSADDARNPIGERWIGLKGIDEETKLLSGYGIHGTIEPESIGRQASMGCIRMAASDVELLYELLVEGKSTVVIHN